MTETEASLILITTALEETVTALNRINKTLAEIEITLRLWSEMEANK